MTPGNRLMHCTVHHSQHEGDATHRASLAKRQTWNAIDQGCDEIRRNQFGPATGQSRMPRLRKLKPRNDSVNRPGFRQPFPICTSRPRGALASLGLHLQVVACGWMNISCFGAGVSQHWPCRSETTPGKVGRISSIRCYSSTGLNAPALHLPECGSKELHARPSCRAFFRLTAARRQYCQIWGHFF